jgi:small subunit ribosomal protein S16
VLRIRLRRVGKKKQPNYRVVIAYNPITQPATVAIDEDKAREWLSKGAVPSERVQKLLAERGIGEMPAFTPKQKKQPEAAPAEA